MKIPKFGDLKKEFDQSILKTAKDESQLMRISKILGTKFSIRVVCAITSAFIFICLNYIINLFGNLITRRDHIFSFFNFFKISFRNIGEYQFIGVLYFVLIVILVVHNIRTIFLFKVNLKEQNINQKGSARWTTTEEIKAQFKEIDDKETRFPGSGGIPVCRIENKLYIDDSNVNTLHIGITRSGKGETFVIPEIDIYARAEEQASLLVLDMKSELIKTSYKPLTDLGYDVQFLNIENPELGIQYNPLHLILQSYKEGDIADAELLCNSFAYSIFASSESAAGDSNAEFFLSNATSAVTALILSHIADCLEEDRRKNAEFQLIWLERQNKFREILSMKEKVELIEKFTQLKYNLEIAKTKKMDGKEIVEQILDNMDFIPENEPYIPYTKNEVCVNMFSIINTFSNLAREYINDHLTKLDIYFQSRPALDRAKGIYASIEVSGDRTKGSIFSQALTKLNLYTYDNIAKLTSTSTFDLTELGFGEKPIALFIGIPFYDRSKDGLVSTLISQVFSANSRKAAKTKDLKCPRKIIYHLDEIGNYPAIKSFDTMLSVGLGTNQIFNLFIQSYNQIDSKYGKDADTIKDNCGYHIYIQTISPDTAEHFSKLIGSETITNITRTGKVISLDKTITEMYDEKPLLNPNELMELLPGENVIKRVMKRTDLLGNLVKPRSIFNNHADGTAFRYRYEYLCGIFLDPDKVEWGDLAIGRSNFSTMELESITYDYNITFEKYEYEYYEKKWQRMMSGKLMENEEPMNEEEISRYEFYKQVFLFDKPIHKISNFNQINEELEKYEIVISNKLTISEFMNNLQMKKNGYNDIPENVIKQIYQLLLESVTLPTNLDSDKISFEGDKGDSSYDDFANFYADLENI